MATPPPDRYTRSVDFRTRLLSTLKAVQNVLNLTVLSLMQGVDGMPDPRPQRARIAAVLVRLEELEVEET